MMGFFMWVGNEGLIGDEYLAAEKAWEHQQERVDELEAENKEIQHALDCMVAATWDLQEYYNALREAAQEAVDTICLPGPGDYYYSAPYCRALAALAAALLPKEVKE